MWEAGTIILQRKEPSKDAETGTPELALREHHSIWAAGFISASDEVTFYLSSAPSCTSLDPVNSSSGTTRLRWKGIKMERSTVRHDARILI